MASFAEFIDPNPAAGNDFGASVVALSTGNVVITSPGDDVGAQDAGAVYLFNGSTGNSISTLIGSTAGDGATRVSGAVSGPNSLVGSTCNDEVGGGSTG